MSALIHFYPVDLTGRNPDNHVYGEPHLLVDHEGITPRVVGLKHGGFYTHNLRVTDALGNVLRPREDYVATYTYEDVSYRTGMEVCGALLFINPSVTGTVHVSAQMVGGDIAYNPEVVEDTIDHLSANPHAIGWAEIVGVPRQYGPGELAAELWEKKSYTGVNRTLEYIARVLQGGNQERLRNYRDGAKDKYELYMSQFGTQTADHEADHTNPHAVHKSQIGLGSVVDRPVSTEQQARGGAHDASYMTPKRTSDAIQTLAVDPLNIHTTRRDNPHHVTAAQIGAMIKSDVDTQLDTKLDFNGTAVNANTISRNRDTGPHWSYAEYFTHLRTNMPSTNFTIGYFPTARLGTGSSNHTHILRGNGSWTSISVLMSIYHQATGGSVYYAGRLSNDTNALNHIRATYSSVTHYPPGTIVLYRATDTQHMYGGNDYGGSRTFQTLRGCLRYSWGWSNFGGVPSVPRNP